MLSGLEILLARAKEYPEEFSNPNGKWRLLIKEILPYLDKDEMMCLEMAMKEVMRSKFNEAVLTTLAGTGEPEKAMYITKDSVASGGTGATKNMMTQEQFEDAYGSRYFQSAIAAQKQNAQNALHNAAAKAAAQQSSPLMGGTLGSPFYKKYL